MRLTDYMKSCIERAAMDDLPKVDYEEQARKIAFREREKLLLKTPKLAQVLAIEPGRLNERYFSLGYGMGSVVLPGLYQDEIAAIESLPELVEIKKQAYKQDRARKEIKDKLHRALKGITTLKQLSELMPGFEKYVPTPEPKSTNLPAISNVVGDFIRAGWPKDKNQAAA